MRQSKHILITMSLFTLFACKEVSENESNNFAENQIKTESNEDGMSDSLKEELTTAVDTLSYAIVNPDRTLFEKIAADDLTYGHSSGLIQNKEEFIDDLINGDFNFSSVDISDQKITIEDETAIVRQIFSAQATNKDEPVDIRIGNILVYVYEQQEDQWKLLARQAFKL